MRSYAMGNPELDETIKDLVARTADNPHQDLIAEIVTTALKLHRDAASRGDLKLINTALKEMRYSMLVFSRHQEPKVTVFGSSRIPRDDPNYALAMEFTGLMAGRGWGVVTGGGPGIMEAGNRGAGLDASYAVNIRLPFEAEANGFVAPERVVNFKYFFTRKLGFVKESHAFALFPGGFGTLDEAFELFTLVQTGKSDLHPIVLLESEGTGYWEPLLSFLEGTLRADGLINPEDLTLFRVTTSVTEAADEIFRFYANYQSQRYVDGKLVLRLKRPPDDDALDALNDEFADIIVGEPITVIDPTPAEVRDEDALECARIAFQFDRRHFGRLRIMVDRLNDLVATPDQVLPPSPFTEEQQERPW